MDFVRSSALGALAVASLLLACGGKGWVPASTPTSIPIGTSTAAPASDFEKVANAVAAFALVTLEDLPTGWSATHRSSSTGLMGFTGGCAALNQDDPVTGSIAQKFSDEFSNANGDAAASQVDVFRTTASASRGFEQLAGLFATCHDQVVSAFTAVLTRNVAPASVQNLHARYGKLDIAPLGDASSAYRLEFSMVANGVDISGTDDTIIMQRGRLLANVTYSAFDTDMIPRDILIQKLSDRLLASDRRLAPQP